MYYSPFFCQSEDEKKAALGLSEYGVSETTLLLLEFALPSRL